MSADQWFGIAMAMVTFAFWVAGAGIVIALIGLFLQMSTPRRQADEPKGFGERLLDWINVAFTKLFDESVPATTKFVALGMVLFMAGLALLVLAIIPALVGVAQTALGGGGPSPTETPTSTPTPSAT